jgi:hypothetical protein
VGRYFALDSRMHGSLARRVRVTRHRYRAIMPDIQ